MRRKQAAAVCIAVILAALLAGCKGSASQLKQQLDLGNKYLAELDFEQAVIAFERAIELEPKKAEAYIGLADAYAAAGRYQEALEALNRVPDDVDDAEAIRQKREEIEALIQAQQSGTEPETAAQPEEEESEAELEPETAAQSVFEEPDEETQELLEGLCDVMDTGDDKAVTEYIVSSGLMEKEGFYCYPENGGEAVVLAHSDGYEGDYYYGGAVDGVPNGRGVWYSEVRPNDYGEINYDKAEGTWTGGKADGQMEWTSYHLVDEYSMVNNIDQAAMDRMTVTGPYADGLPNGDLQGLWVFDVLGWLPQRGMDISNSFLQTEYTFSADMGRISECLFKNTMGNGTVTGWQETDEPGFYGWNPIEFPSYSREY